MSQPELKQIPINQIFASSNYRKTFKDKSLAELAASIKANGVLQPIIVRPSEPGKFTIIAGERRYRASKLAGLVTIPAVVRDIPIAETLKLQIIENIQREGVPFMEEAYAIKKLRDDLVLDRSEIAKMVGKSYGYVFYMLKLCEISDEARSIAEKGWISKMVAWEISKLPNPEYQTQAANDLARTKADKLVTIGTAKSYIADIFGDSKRRLRKDRVNQFGPASDYAADWKKYLVKFTGDQFEHFKTVVRGRTETAILSEAVDIVMRGK